MVAVDGIDLDVVNGEFFAVLGPSGSGKTTVLRMIAGFETPTSGTIELEGRDASHEPPFRRDVNTVFQDYALFPHMSVAQNIEYGLKVKKVAKAERVERVADALDLVRLGHVAARRPAQLSGGQRQRIALARALVNRPKVLLLDEPLGALDLKLREQMQAELKAIQREVGITFVFVTHDQDEALTLCDRLAVMRDGRIEQVGLAREVYEDPTTLFVADFVGTSNVITGAMATRLLGSADTHTVRPEQISVLPLGSASDGRITVDGVVTEIVYAGAESRVLVDVGGGETEPPLLTALRLNAAGADHSLERGSRVTLAWPRLAVRRLEGPHSPPPTPTTTTATTHKETR